LAGQLKGTLLQPGDPGYAAGCALYNEVYAPDPAAVALCAAPSDVQRCVSFARDHGVALTARSGGHSYGGYSSCPGLVINVTPMNAVALGGVGPSGQPQASVGAGAHLIDVYSQLGGQGMLLPGGSCPTVGIAGLALGGGIGVFGRAFGLTSDQIEELTIVTADGSLVQCGPSQNEDLYWASRGGGGGNYGIVTSFQFRVRPIPADITLFTLEWPWADAATVLDAWLRWIPLTPNELWANCHLVANGTAGSGLVKVTGVFIGPVPACASALSPLTTTVGSATTYRFVGPESYLTAMMIEGGCEGKPVAQCATPVMSPFAAKSSFVSGVLPAPVVSALVSAVSSLPATLPGAGGGIVFDGYGGAINEVGATETAFVHRSAVACAQYEVTFATAPATPSAASGARAWLSHLESVLAPLSSGSYQNYIDPTLADWTQAYYGVNLPRLRQIKARRDPDDVFRFAQSIPLPA
jgi:FAD/FMN-containing dehydrogenase